MVDCPTVYGARGGDEMKPILLFFFLLFGMFTFQVVHYIKFSEQMSKFVSVGKRFTADSGQELCERFAKMEKDPQPCEYNK